MCSQAYASAIVVKGLLSSMKKMEHMSKKCINDGDTEQAAFYTERASYLRDLLKQDTITVQNLSR